jgi:cobalt-zinc-cadmium efflux system outer membrane protein
VVRAQAELAVLDVRTIELKGERASIVEMMNALRNAPAGTDFPDPVHEVRDSRLAGVAVLSKRALANRPELRGMNAMRNEELSMAALARRERYPDLMTGVWYNQMLGGPDTVGVMFGATLPVFGVARQNRTAQAADLRAAAAGQDLAAMAAMIRFEVVDALSRAETARKASEFIGSVALRRAQDSFASSLAAYAAGAVDMVAVLEAWRSLQQVELARAEAGVALAVARADLERAVAGSVEP